MERGNAGGNKKEKGAKRMVKRIIRKAKRFIHSIKVRWKIMRSLRHWKSASYRFQMGLYDTAQWLKRMKLASGQRLTNIAEAMGIERLEGESDGEFRKRIFKIHSQTGKEPVWFTPGGGRQNDE